MDQRGGYGLSSEEEEEDQSLRVQLLVESLDPENADRNGTVEEEEEGHLLQGEKKQDDDPAASSFTFILLYSVIIACCGSLATGNALGYTSPVEVKMKSDLSLTTSQFSFFGSLLNVGAVVGSLMSGSISDRIGRRYTIALGDTLCIFGWLIIALSQDAWSLYLGRLLVGYAMGIFSYVVPTYIAEVIPKNLRGGGVLACNLALASGIALTWMVGLIVSWRTLAYMIGIIPCMIQLLGLYFVPESPRWLLKMGYNEQYQTVLQQLRGFYVDISQEAAEIKVHNQDLQKVPNVNFYHLFQRKYAYALTIVLGLKTLTACSGAIGMLFYADSVFESAGLSTTTGSITVAFTRVLSTIVGLLLMDRVGRRPLLMISASGMCFGCILSGLSFMLQDHQLLADFSPYLILLGILLFFAWFPIGMAGIPSVIMSEMFPMNAKGSAGSLATMVSWLAAWILSYTFDLMVEWSPSGTFILFACVNAFSVWFVAKMVQETKKKSLEEIQESTTKNNSRMKLLS